ncbi:MAG: histidine kinase [Pirellulales bacterium]
MPEFSNYATPQAAVTRQAAAAVPKQTYPHYALALGKTGLLSAQNNPQGDVVSEAASKTTRCPSDGPDPARAAAADKCTPRAPTPNSTTMSGHEVDALRSKAEMLQTIVDSLSDGLAAVDRSGQFVQFNPSGAAILGRGATEGPYEAWPKKYGLFLPDRETPFPHEELPLVRALKGDASRNVEMYHASNDGTDGRWLKVTGAPVRDASGQITGGVVLFRDETVTKQAQEALESERRYLRHLIQWQDSQRRLTACDLHDGLVQLVTGAVLHLEGYRSKHVAQDSPAESEVAGILTMLRDALDEARRLIAGLQPPVLDERGVVGAVEYLVEQHRAESGLVVEFSHDLRQLRWPSIVEATVFRITQEALQNVARHADTRRAAVDLKQVDDNLQLTVRDWGRGFNVQQRQARRFGLRGIAERCRLLGGSVTIESRPGNGTTVAAVLPTNPTLHDSEEGAS